MSQTKITLLQTLLARKFNLSTVYFTKTGDLLGSEFSPVQICGFMLYRNKVPLVFTRACS